ncbi:hypothetical protein T439DRAFT_189135 [Meredithblackwellia eburnea MCA 4105]
MTAQPVAVALHSAKESKPVKPQSKCSYCDKTFKKLEHRQRHERVRTLRSSLPASPADDSLALRQGRAPPAHCHTPCNTNTITNYHLQSCRHP